MSGTPSLLRSAVVALLLVATLTATLLGVGALTGAMALATGIGWVAGLNKIALLALAALAITGRLALPVRWSIRGSTWIDAPVDVVWDRIAPRPREDHYLSSVSRVRAVDGAPDRLDIHFDSRLDDDGHSPVLKARIVHCDPPHHAVLETLNPEDFPLFSRHEVAEEFRVAPEAGGTRLEIADHLRAFSPSALLVFIHINPVQQAADRVKALIEGDADRSWSARALEEIDAETGEPHHGPAQREFAACAVVFAIVAVLAGLGVMTALSTLAP